MAVHVTMRTTTALFALAALVACRPADAPPTKKAPPTTVVDTETSGPTTSTSTSVVVVGGGLSGLVTARELVASGIEDVVVLEARDRVGGRTYNQVLDGGVVAEGGGQWIGPSQTEMVALTAELGIATFPQYYEGDTVYYFNENRTLGDLSNPPNVQANIDQAVDKLEAMAATLDLSAPWAAADAEAWDAMTVDEWLIRELTFGGFVNAYLDFEFNIQAELSASATDVSLLWYVYYIASAGSVHDLSVVAQELKIDGGAMAVSEAIAAELGDRVRLSSPVTQIAWTADGATVMTASEVFEADRVVVAMMPATATKIAFSPELPADRVELMEEWPTTGQGYKVSVLYDTPFWRDAGLSGIAITDDPPVEFTFDNSPADGSTGVLTAFVLENAMNGNPLEREEAVVQNLVDLFGPEAANHLDFAEQNWSEEAWTTGCVSPIQPGLLTRVGHTLREPVGAVHWAGTETSDVWNGYMEGAVRAGQRAAAEVVQAR